MARKKRADNPVTSQETSARNTTEVHIPESGLIETSSDRESAQPGEATFKDDARAAIFARRKEFLEKETGIAESGVISAEPIIENAVEESAKETPSPSNPVATESTPAAASQTPEETPLEQSSQTESQKYKFVADGQTFECTADELVTMAQRGVGAGRKFQEASEKERRAEALALMFSPQNLQPQTANNQQTQQQPLEVDENKLKDIAKRLNYGSEEDQINALKEAGTLFASNAGKTAQQLNPNEIVDIVTRNVSNALSANQEQEILKNEFKDILSDQPLAQATDFIAKQLDQKYAALGEQKSRLEILREAGLTARERYLKPAASVSQPNSSAPATPTVADMANKVERKRAAPQPPTSANKVASDESQPYGVPSIQALDAARKKAFNDISRRRGQSA